VREGQRERERELHARDLAGVISIFRAMPRSTSLAEPLTYLMTGTSRARAAVLSLPDFTPDRG